MEELVAAIRALLDQAEAEDRPLTDEESERVAQYEKDIAALRRTSETRSRLDAYETPVNRIGFNRGGGDEAAESRAFERYFRSGDEAEIRALAKGTDSAGGYLVPDQWREKLVQCIKSFGGVAEHAEEITTATGQKMFWPTVTDETTGTPNTGALVAEAAAFAGGADPVFGENSLDVYKYTTTGDGNNPVRVSVELLQDSMINVDDLLRRLFGVRLARSEAAAWATGTGSGQPKGILNGTADVELATSNAFDGTNNGYAKLLAIVTALDTHYLPNARWVLNKTMWAQILGLVDDVGRPLLQPQNVAGIGGRPEMTLLGYPVTVDQTFPSAADDVNFMVFGDIRQAYVIRRVAGGVNVIADPYSRKSNGQVEYVAWERVGGTVQDRCAYVLVKGKDA